MTAIVPQTDPMPAAARTAAGQALREFVSHLAPDRVSDVDWDHLHPTKQDQWGSHAATIVAAALAAIDPALLSTNHVLRITDDSWSLQHPLTCRPVLTECSMHQALSADDEFTWAFEPGEYTVTLADCGCLLQPGQECQNQSEHAADEAYAARA